jgi:hypothetical protein
MLARLILSMVHLRRRRHDALFPINVFVNKTTCPSILNTFGLQVPSKIRDHSMFTAVYCAKDSHFARCFTAANAVCSTIVISTTVIFR